MMQNMLNRGWQMGATEGDLKWACVNSNGLRAYDGS